MLLKWKNATNPYLGIEPKIVNLFASETYAESVVGMEVAKEIAESKKHREWVTGLRDKCRSGIEIDIDVDRQGHAQGQENKGVRPEESPLRKLNFKKHFHKQCIC